jgi:hypothetical protein
MRPHDSVSIGNPREARDRNGGGEHGSDHHRSGVPD